MARQVIILFLAVLVAVVTGCGGAHRYDGRLVQADSLMQANPDSALAIVEAVNADSLSTQGDRAYRDLLLTQARYICYVTATSDSDINRALTYYRHHNKGREKLTRAYIYKGAVMEELGHPDSAMFYYKIAEATADSKDYANLGYIKMRMGSLYSMYYDMEGKNIMKLQEALDFFTKTNDINNQYLCLNNLGCLYRDSKPQKAEQLLKKALAISKQANDTINLIEDYNALIVLYFYHNQNEKALNTLREATSIDLPKPSFDFCTTAANVYARAGNLDSALLYLNMAKSYDIANNAEYQMYLLETLSEIALSKGDTVTYMKLSVQWKQISDSLITNSQKVIIAESEEKINKNRLEAVNEKASKAIQIITIIIVVASIFVALLWYFHRRRIRRYRNIIERLKNEADEQFSVLKALQLNIDDLKIKDQKTKDFIDSQLHILQDITMACYNEQETSLGKQVKMIVQLQHEDKHKWTQMYNYIDSEYNNIISNTRKSYPQLNDNDLLLLALNCLGFSYIQIAMIMGYSNATSVGTIKNRLAKKMQIDYSLNDYIRMNTTMNESAK